MWHFGEKYSWSPRDSLLLHLTQLLFVFSDNHQMSAFQCLQCTKMVKMVNIVTELLLWCYCWDFGSKTAVTKYSLTEPVAWLQALSLVLSLSYFTELKVISTMLIHFWSNLARNKQNSKTHKQQTHALSAGTTLPKQYVTVKWHLLHLSEAMQLYIWLWALIPERQIGWPAIHLLLFPETTTKQWPSTCSH